MNSSSPVESIGSVLPLLGTPGAPREHRRPALAAGNAPGEASSAVAERLRATVAWLMLGVIYGGLAFVCALLRGGRRRRRKPSGRICVTGTFHNPNWYQAHITPLAECGVREVILVVDQPQARMPNLRFVCPPAWAARFFTRAGAKFLWMLIAGVKYRPDFYMGYHILPGAASALLAGRLFGRPAGYQMTGGPIEIDGGGAHSESWLSGSLNRPSRLLERLAVQVVRQFDLVVVRGRQAAGYLAQRGIRDTVQVITGGVRCAEPRGSGARQHDLIYVGRLSPFKQPEQFVQIAAAVREQVPSLRAAVLGDGPLAESLRDLASRLHVADCIDWLGQRDDPERILAAARVFVLTSRSEGLSIAMAEAMAAGVVPVVARVGELGDLVEEGVSGFLITPNRIAEYAARIVSLLQDPEHWERFSCAAREAARCCGLAAVTERWRATLRPFCPTIDSAEREEQR